jgi:hypothetical protein
MRIGFQLDSALFERDIVDQSTEMEEKSKYIQTEQGEVHQAIDTKLGEKMLAGQMIALPVYRYRDAKTAGPFDQ